MASSSNFSASTTSSEIQEAALISKSLSPRCPFEERESAYLKVISQSTSSSLYLRKLVGRLVPQYFAEFNALQEKAVDAICDLCEDSEKEIRILGCNAFEQISRVANSWVKRNTDVLIQLLQIDMEDEILILRRLIAAHIDISISALSVIIDSLADPGMEVVLKSTLVDIITVEGTQWRNKNMPSTSRSGPGIDSESEGGRVLREGLYLILSQSPPLALAEKIFSLLFLLPLPTIARRTTHILSYSYPSPLPPSLFTIAQQYTSTARPELVDPRSFVRYYFEQPSNPFSSSSEEVDLELSQERILLIWIKQWAEREWSGTLKQEIEGDEDTWAGEIREKEKIVKDGRERWQRVLDNIANRVSSKVLPLLRSGRRDRNGLNLPFQALETSMFILFYLSRIPSVTKQFIDPSSPLVQYINQRIGPGRPHEKSSGSLRLAQSNVWFLLDFFRAPLPTSNNAPWSNRRISFSWEMKQSSNPPVTNVSPNIIAPAPQSMASTPVIHGRTISSRTSPATPSAPSVNGMDRKTLTGTVPTISPSVSKPRPATLIHSSSSDLLQRLIPQSSQGRKDLNHSLPRHSSQIQQRSFSVPKPSTLNAQNQLQSEQAPNLSNAEARSDPELRLNLSKHEGPNTGLGFSIKGRASSAVTATVPSPLLSTPAAMPSLRDRLAPSMGSIGERDGTHNTGRSLGESQKKRKSTGSSGGRRKR